MSHTEELIKISGKGILLCALSGRIISVQKNNEVNIYSSVGGGVITGGHGVIYPAYISSENITITEIWIDSDGREISIQLAGPNIAMRQGQTIGYIYAVINNNTFPLKFYNHTSGDIYDLSDSNEVLKQGLINTNFNFLINLLVMYFLSLAVLISFLMVLSAFADSFPLLPLSRSLYAFSDFLNGLVDRIPEEVKKALGNDPRTFYYFWLLLIFPSVMYRSNRVHSRNKSNLERFELHLNRFEQKVASRLCSP